MTFSVLCMILYRFLIIVLMEVYRAVSVVKFILQLFRGRQTCRWLSTIVVSGCLKKLTRVHRAKLTNRRPFQCYQMIILTNEKLSVPFNDFGLRHFSNVYICECMYVYMFIYINFLPHLFPRQNSHLYILLLNFILLYIINNLVLYGGGVIIITFL